MTDNTIAPPDQAAANQQPRHPVQSAVVDDDAEDWGTSSMWCTVRFCILHSSKSVFEDKKKDDNRRSIPVSQFRLSIVVFPLYFAFRVTALPQYRYFMSLRRALVFVLPTYYITVPDKVKPFRVASFCDNSNSGAAKQGVFGAFDINLI